MAKSTVLGGMVLVGVLGGCGDKADDSASARVDDILSLTGDTTSGASVYTSNCSACHGTSGEGGTGPAMSEVVSTHTDEQLVDVILSGASGMPAFDSLADQDIADLVAYLTDTF